MSLDLINAKRRRVSSFRASRLSLNSNVKSSCPLFSNRFLLITPLVFFLVFPTSIGQNVSSLTNNFAALAAASSTRPPLEGRRPAFRYANEHRVPHAQSFPSQDQLGRQVQISASSPAFELSQRRQHANNSTLAQSPPVVEAPLPSCSVIPRLLCCTSRVLAKCYEGCVEYVRDRCAHKLRPVDHFSVGPKFVDHEIAQQPVPAAWDNDADLLVSGRRPSIPLVPLPQASSLSTSTIRLVPSAAPSALQPPPSKRPPQAQPYIVDRDVELPSAGGFIAPLILDSPPQNRLHSSANVGVLTTTIKSVSSSVSSIQSHDMANLLHEQQIGVLNSSTPASAPTFDVYARRRGSEAGIGECGTAQSQPPFSPCHPRRLTDDLFGSCCEERVPASCRSLCTYEHREQQASENLVRAIQDRGCDLKWLSAILSCANQNHDNRPCCRHLGLAGAELGVGDRCLRMCAVGDAQERTIGVVEQNDLVCLSNLNVIMYCARSGLRTL